MKLTGKYIISNQLQGRTLKSNSGILEPYRLERENEIVESGKLSAFLSWSGG